jgi:hypothetical protein
MAQAIEPDPPSRARFGLGYAGHAGRFDEAQREIAADRMYEIPPSRT